MELCGLHAVGHPGGIFRNVMALGKPFIAVFENGLTTANSILDNIFRVLDLEADLEELSIDASIVQAHPHSAGTKKGAIH